MRNITTPPGRIVGGSLYEGRKTDGDGKPFVYKTGAKKDQPYAQHSFGIAIPKEAGHTHWNQTAWGAQLWEEGKISSPNSHHLKSFSWKITDGDSAEENKKGNKPCDQEGYKGSWVVWFQANDFVVPVYNANGTQRIEEPGAVKPGYWIQVRFECNFNQRTDSPGMYLAQKMVAYSAPDTEIILRVQEDVAEAGFGQAPLPAGVSAVPVGQLADPTAPAPTTAPVTTTVTPAPNFLAPATPTAPAAPTAPVAPTGPQPTAKAWTTLEGMLAAEGWTMELLIKEGYVTA